VPAPLQTEGYDGVLEPLAPLKRKLLIMRGVDHVRADKKGINAHFDGSSAAFTAEAPANEARSGGPSIDQLIRQTHYPDGTAAASMQERPRDVFERVFGKVGVELAGLTDEQKRRRRQGMQPRVVAQVQREKAQSSPARHAHMKLREVAHFLSRLDSDDCREANGRTILENSMITVSTESGDGRHTEPLPAGSR